MNSIKGIYHNGIVELLGKPKTVEPTEVMAIFPEKKKKVIAIKGLFKGQAIDYGMIEEDLKNLNSESEKHIFEEHQENEYIWD